MIHNGFYTIKNVTTGNHRTFRIKTQPEHSNFAAGKRIVGLLTGPDNTANYRNFAFLSDSGIHVWQKFKGKPDKPSEFEIYANMLWKLLTSTNSVYHGKCTIQCEKHCLRCNRVLTHPDSQDTGFGPECIKLIRKTTLLPTERDKTWQSQDDW